MATKARRIDTLQTVELAEGMEIHLRAAGPFLRFLAYLIDLCAEFALLLILGIALNLAERLMGSNVSQAFYLLGVFFVWWFYHVIFELSAWGATFGKKAMGLRVVNQAGASITLGQSMIRNFIRGVEMIIPFAPLVAFFHPRFQRLGDIAAGTLVVYSRARIDPQTPAPPALDTVPVNFALTREEQAAILSFRDRSGGWSEARRAELGNHLKPLTGQVGMKGVGQILGMAHWLEDRK